MAIRNPATDPAAIPDAAALLRSGRVVAFPTETVYGLGAHAFDADAVERIFALKVRPADNPMIVHVGRVADVGAVAREVPEVARRLLGVFAPGPLTVVLPRRDTLPDNVTAGLDSVAVRVPDDPIALALIEALGAPIAAPSANRSGRPSPTTASDVAADFGDALPLILDGGPTLIGLESTVVDATGARPRLLRPGGISLEEIEAVIGPIERGEIAGELARSPGIRHRHYAPRCRVVLAAPGQIDATIAAQSAGGARVGVLCRAPLAGQTALSFEREAPGEIAAFGRAIFRAFRDAEACGVEVLIVETVPETGLGLAIMDRLRRAAAPE